MLNCVLTHSDDTRAVKQLQSQALSQSGQKCVEIGCLNMNNHEVLACVLHNDMTFFQTVRKKDRKFLQWHQLTELKSTLVGKDKGIRSRDREGQREVEREKGESVRRKRKTET